MVFFRDEIWKIRIHENTFNRFAEFVNPKAIETTHLFGAFEPINMEWTDGVVSSIFRRFSVENQSDSFKWIVFDGPVYSEWIENLNTLLDDNRKLCLNSGEVLDLADNSLIIFEVENLSRASPSTVSSIVLIFQFELKLYYLCTLY